MKCVTLPRWVALYPGGDTVVVDLDTGGVAHLTPGDDVVYIQDATAIVRRGKQLIARDCVSGKEQQLGSPLARFGDVLVAGSAVYVPPFIVRLSSKDARVKVLGRAPAQALGLSDRGTVLVPAKPGSVASPAQGPLRWVAPEAFKRP